MTKGEAISLIEASRWVVSVRRTSVNVYGTRRRGVRVTLVEGNPSGVSTLDIIDRHLTLRATCGWLVVS